MVKVANSFVSTENCVVCTVEVHHIAENFHELVKNTIFAEKTFADCLLLPCQWMPCPQISQRKLSQIATKPQNSRKFSLLKVSHYIRYTFYQHAGPVKVYLTMNSTWATNVIFLLATKQYNFFFFISQLACYEWVLNSCQLMRKPSSFYLSPECCLPVEWACVIKLRTV